MSSKILVLPGDGIGVEVADQAIRVIDKLNELGLDATYEKELVGGASYDANGEPLTSEVLEKAKQSDAILLGAVGGSKWDDVERSKRPEAGLLGLRKELELFANLRPALVFEALASASTLKDEVVSNLDIMIVRELTGGVYFGQPRGIEDTSDGKKAVDTQVYYDYEIDRISLKVSSPNRRWYPLQENDILLGVLRVETDLKGGNWPVSLDSRLKALSISLAKCVSIELERQNKNKEIN